MIRRGIRRSGKKIGFVMNFMRVRCLCELGSMGRYFGKKMKNKWNLWTPYYMGLTRIFCTLLFSVYKKPMVFFFELDYCVFIHGGFELIKGKIENVAATKTLISYSVFFNLVPISNFSNTIIYFYLWIYFVRNSNMEKYIIFLKHFTNRFPTLVLKHIDRRSSVNICGLIKAIVHEKPTVGSCHCIDGEWATFCGKINIDIEKIINCTTSDKQGFY